MDTIFCKCFFLKLFILTGGIQKISTIQNNSTAKIKKDVPTQNTSKTMKKIKECSIKLEEDSIIIYVFHIVSDSISLQNESLQM